MALFGKKEAPAPVQNTTPVDDILRMRQQGFSNNQIVQALQRNGYQTHQIFDAMNQADLRSAAPIQGAVPPDMAQELPDMPQEMQRPQHQPQPAPEPQPEYEHNPDERIEEVAEAIIEEKWEDLIKQHEKLLTWKDGMEQKIVALESRFEDLSKQFTSLQQTMLGKAGEYDKTMRTVSADMKAMEQVFEKLLPALTENVAELTRLTKKTKHKKT